jgi:hypothetical protein
LQENHLNDVGLTYVVGKTRIVGGSVECFVPHKSPNCVIPILRKPEPDNFLKLALGASFKKLSVVGF